MTTLKLPIDMAKADVQLLKSAAELARDVVAVQSKLAATAPIIADMLISQGLLDPMEKDAAEKKLADPTGVQEILMNVTKKAGQPRPMGTPVKQAADGFGAGETADEKFIRNVLGIND